MAHGIEAALLPTREALWRDVAASIGGSFAPGDFWTPDAVLLESSGWTLRLCQDRVDSPLTLVEADPVLIRPVRLTLLRGEFARRWRGIDLAPRALYGPAFFGGCQLLSADPALARDLFDSPGLRSRLMKEPHAALSVRPGALRLAALGDPGEKPRLIGRIALALEILQRLRELGYARECAPSDARETGTGRRT